MQGSATTATRYQTLLEVSESIAAHQQLQTLIPELARSLKRLVSFDALTLTLFHADTRSMQLLLVHSNFKPPIEPEHRIPVEATPAVIVIETGRPHFVADIQKDDRFPALHNIMRGIGIRSYVIAPMITARHGFLGGLNFGSFTANAYSPEDIDFLSQVARQVAIAVENALAHEELARERDHLRLLLDVNNAAATHLDVPDLVRATTKCLRDSLGVEFAGVTLGDTAPEAPAGLTLLSAPLRSRGRTLGSLTIGTRNPVGHDHGKLLSEVADQIAIAIDNALSYQRIEELNARLEQEKLYLEDEIRTQFRFEEIIGRSPALVSVLRQVETVAPSDSAVVIYGETGTGKELVARAIHELSTRRNNTFVKLNCAAIPTGLLESELFGHEKGAFTGAIARRVGRFELADGGTLFLDEVGEIPLELQPKLLRVLQEQEFERLGSSKTQKVNVRVVAATNRDLLQMVRERRFRDDLYYRLNVFPIHIPPLRERRDDIPMLVRHFAQQAARRMSKQIETVPSEAMAALTAYSWPGNVRELQNLIERAVIISQGSVLQVPLEDVKTGMPAGGTLEQAERAHILEVLEKTRWVLSGPNGAAARLGLKRPTLQFKMKKLGISRPA